MPEIRLPKAMMQRIIGGKKRKGRPRTRWVNKVEKNLEQMKIIRYK